MAKKELHLPEEPKRTPPMRADILPTEGYGLEVDGKVKHQFDTREAAEKAGTELKKKFPVIQVKIFDAKARTRTHLPE
jgi:hypothetical protein